MKRRTLACVLGALCALPAPGVAPLGAQGTWDATLSVDPNPSPYLADWESNQSLGTLTVTNGTSAAQSVRLVFSVVSGQGRVMVSGSSEPQLIPAGSPAIFHSPVSIAGRTRHDAEMEAQMRRTGRLPEGTYRLCITVVDLGGFELAEACEGFTLVYPEPPMLVSPAHQEVVATSDLFFQWTPSHVPIGIAVRYVLQVAELRPGQLASEALKSSALHFADANVSGAHLQYPMDAPRMRAGQQYAWRVQALDANGYPVASNEGSSETWTFRFSDGTDANPTAPPGTGAPGQFELVLASDEVPADGGVTLRPSIGALCATGDQWARGEVDSTLVLRIAGPAMPKGRLAVQVQYAVDTLLFGVVSYRWMVHGRNSASRLEVFATGDCDGPATDLGASRLHYVAAKRGQPSFDEFLKETLGGSPEASAEEPEGQAVQYTPQEGFNLDFATAVLSLRSRQIGEKDEFTMEKDFFGGHRFEVKPGINVFGVVRLDETGDMWPQLRTLGFGKNTYDIYGFAGMSAEASVGAGYAQGDGAEVDVSVKRDFFKLRIDLPAMDRIKVLKSVRAGVEFLVNDSLATGVGGTESLRSRHIIGRLVVALETHNESVIELAGGFDTSVDQKLDEAPKDRKWELVLSGGCACAFEFPVGAETGFIGNPAIEFHFGPERILIVTGEFGLAKWPPVLVGVSWTWERGESAVMQTADRMLAHAEQREKAAVAALEAHDAAQALNPAPPPGPQRQNGRSDAQERRLSLALEVDAAKEALRFAKTYQAGTEDREQPKTPEGQRLTPMRKKDSFDWDKRTWRFRIAAGNVPIGDYFDVIRAAIK